MHTTLTDTRGKFHTEILSHFWEIAVFVRVHLFSCTLYISMKISNSDITIMLSWQVSVKDRKKGFSQKTEKTLKILM